MALQKKIILKNGIETNYHRITSLNFITNWSINIEVRSYISKDGRAIEQAYQTVQKKVRNGQEITEEEKEILNKGAYNFSRSEIIEINYDEDLSIKNIYEYLKTTDKYKDAIDV